MMKLLVQNKLLSIRIDSNLQASIQNIVEDRCSQQGWQGEEGDRGGRVTFVLLTEAHDAVLSSLRHTDVVHHEEVDVNLVRAGPPDGLVFSSPVLDQLDTAAVALLDWRHVPRVGREHERVPAPGVCVRVTVETVNLLAS